MGVTLKQLEQYEAMMKEKKLWEAELNALYKKYGGSVKDTVRERTSICGTKPRTA